jgi:AMP-binding enzyme/Phosphopantetheine attachment site
VHGRFGSAARLINVYGPTETSCICSSLELDAAALAAASGPLPSLGRMHADFSHLVLDDDGKLLPPGATGELWIGGPNVGLGYFANSKETARRFRQDPLQDNYRNVYYRSGDLVRQDEQGLLWFQGRADNQIKIAGHRVELEEIDGALEAQPGVGRALTVLSHRAGTAELVAAFEARETVNVAVLMTALAARLPHYMRPARLIELQKLPFNANGKVDRRAIQALADAAEPIEASAAQQTPEERVRGAWAAALGHAAFTNTDSFFDLGGTSLALTRVHAALSAQFPDGISMLDLFANPTIARTVQFLDGRGAVAAPRDTAPTDRARRQQEAIARARARVPGGSA